MLKSTTPGPLTASTKINGVQTPNQHRVPPFFLHWTEKGDSSESMTRIFFLLATCSGIVPSSVYLYLILCVWEVTTGSRLREILHLVMIIPLFGPLRLYLSALHTIQKPIYA